MTQIKGGIEIKELLGGGVVFEVIPPNEDEAATLEEAETEEDKKYFETLDQFAKLDCVNFDYDNFNGIEPFDLISQKMRNILDDGKIQKRILREGYGEKPINNVKVKIHYNAYVEYEPSPFDSTYARKKPFGFTLGEGQVIEGLEIAVKTMQLHELAQFLIHPNLAYRNSGLNRIPPNSTILFEIELCQILETCSEVANSTEEMVFDYIYKNCLALCVKGKNLFRLKDFHRACKVYEDAIHKLEEVELSNYEEQLKCDELIVRLSTNIIVCSTHIPLPKKGCIYAQKIYEMAGNNTFQISSKVYFNHAKCLRMLGEFKRAENKLNEAKKLEAKNPEILQEFLALKNAREEKKQRDTNFGKALLKN